MAKKLKFKNLLHDDDYGYGWYNTVVIGGNEISIGDVVELENNEVVELTYIMSGSSAPANAKDYVHESNYYSISYKPSDKINEVKFRNINLP